jgi:outer membrane protein W
MKKISIVAIILVISTAGFAQDFFTGVGWTIGFPYGENTADLIGNTSYRGFFVEGRKFTSKNLSFGMAFGWNVFNELVEEDYNNNNNDEVGITVSGKQNRSLNFFPILVTSHYHLRNSKKIIPFVGIGAGTYYINERVDIGVYSFGNDNWHWALAPEVGVTFKMSYYMKGMVSLKYNYAFESGKGSQHSFIGLNIGIAYY